MLERIKTLEKTARLLDPGAEQRTKWNSAVMSHAQLFLDDLDQTKVFIQNDDKGKGIMAFEPSDEPAEIHDLLEGLKKHVELDGINPASGAHMGYIPGGGLYPSALGDYLADISNKYAGIFFPAPGAVRLENMLINWMCELMGFPKTATGNLTSGGSISNLIAIVTAREALGVKAKDFHRLVVYLSDQAHHSIQKALRIAGLGEAEIRYLSIDEEFRISAIQLEAFIKDDLANDLIPFFINGSLGTTNTGTIDPIADLAEIARKYKVWFHVDAAYGGFFKLLPALNSHFVGIEKADSIALDPHKSLFLPFGSGAVIIKDVESLYKAHRYTADYLQDIINAGEEINPADVSPELTKHFRGLRMWLPLKLFGLRPFRAALEEKMMLARFFHQEIKKVPGFVAGPDPDLSVTIFRFVPVEGDAKALNMKLIKAIQDDGRIFLSSTKIQDVVWIRVAILVFRTHLSHIDQLLDIIREKSKELR